MQGIFSLAPFDWVLRLLRDSVAVFAALLLLATAVFIVVLLVGLLAACRDDRARLWRCRAPVVEWVLQGS